MLHSLFIAFRTYSVIPVPEAEWTEYNMRYSVCFFPLIGVVIGGAEFLWMLLARAIGCGQILYAAIAAAIPLLLTGGIHMDGFCDTTDALSSHQERERKLEILKDSHAGAFAIIFAGIWLLLYFGSFSQIVTYRSLWLIGFGFLLSRSLSGFCLVTFRNARAQGMLRTFADAAQKQTVQFSMLIYMVICVAGLLIAGGLRGLLVIGLNAAVLVYYRHMAYKQFGGITGDLAGWFLQMAELFTALGAALTAL